MGFSTLLLYETWWDGRGLEVLCSGDTIVDPEAWGSMALARSWLRAVSSCSDRFYSGGLYWLLICSGYRTYRFLPVFWKRFHPHPITRASPATRGLMEHLARERWGGAFRAEHGTVCFHEPQALRPELSPVTRERLRDPYTRHFVRSNPGHAKGDELVCLAELHPDNLTRAGRRILRAVESPAALEEAV